MNEADRNKGFSLIELVVTVAIMGIVVLISVNLYRVIEKADMNSAVENVDTMLSSLRSKTLSKGNEYMLRVEKDGDSSCKVEVWEKAPIFAADGSLLSEGNWKVLESERLKNVTVSASDGEGTEKIIESGCVIEVQCSKSNGSYTRSEYIDSAGVKTGNIKQIYITKGDRKKAVKLILSTGRHYVD